MQAFLHDRQDRYQRLLASSTGALRSYTARDLNTTQTALSFLDTAAKEYHALGGSTGENEMVGLLAQLASAHEGVDPLTSQRVAQRRREMERAVALRVLLTAADRLRADLAADQATLDRTKEQLAPLVVHAVNKGFVVLDPGRAVTQNDVERMWQELLLDMDAAPTARLVCVQVSRPDVLLLLADLLAGLG